MLTQNAAQQLNFASVITLALNVADPLVAGEYGKAAFDAVGPLLLIGWAEVGPGFLQAVGAVTSPETAAIAGGIGVEQERREAEELVRASARSDVEPREPSSSEFSQRASRRRPWDLLLQQARQQDAAHRAAHQKPISADTLRVRLGIGTTSARRLVKIVRAEFEANGAPAPGDEEPARGPRKAADATLAA